MTLLHGSFVHDIDRFDCAYFAVDTPAEAWRGR